MQGPPRASVDALTAADGRESRREHPEAKRRRLQAELDELEGEFEEASIEDRLVQNAGAVSSEEMQAIGLTRPMDPYTRQVPAGPAGWRGAPMYEEMPEPQLTMHDRIIELIVEAQSALNAIAVIVASIED